MTTACDRSGEHPRGGGSVAIVGCGAVTALGCGVGTLERGLTTNASALAPTDRVEGWSGAAGSVPADVWDRLLTRAGGTADAAAFALAREAIAEARLGVRSRVAAGAAPDRWGLVLATAKADVTALESLRLGRDCSETARRHVSGAALARDLAAESGIGGPVACVSVACVSGLLALGLGAEMLNRGEIDVAVVAGVDLLSRFILAGFTSLRALDPDGCRPFDRERKGLSVGEGAGAVILVRSAESDGDTPRMLGWGSAGDANHLTGPSRDGSGMALAMRRALDRAAVDPGAVDYVHVHGTATQYNDAMEALALRAVFGERGVPPFASSKGMLGHTLGAAGILETILCLIALRLEIAPGTPRLQTRAPEIPESVLIAPRRMPGLSIVLKANAGFGGTNAAVVVGRGPE